MPGMLSAAELGEVYGGGAQAGSGGGGASGSVGTRVPCGGCRFCPAVRRNEHPEWHPPANPSHTGLRIFNSLTKAKELFAPIEGRTVRWYTCGPTVYDVAHMGHARAYLTFDILRRVMEDYLGYEVLFQINITDIDDKIILRARRNKLLADYRARAGSDAAAVGAYVAEAEAAFDAKMNQKLAELSQPCAPGTPQMLVDERAELLEVQGLKMGQWAETRAKIAAARAASDASALIDAAAEPLSEKLDAELGSSVTDQSVFEAHARRYEAEFLADMAALGVRPPSVMSRVTECVPEIVAFVQTIVAKGLAYESNGSVYMDIGALKERGHAYRKLVPASAEAADTTEAQMSEGEGALGAGGEKRNKNDFALWKASKAGEPSWDSPWGGGRPGWHIECSVMASHTFGAHMDMHAGGSDLKFPHHDNELAQSEAFHGCQQWVNYFLHAGHLNIKGHKMSKSLKNFVTIREALHELGHTARQIRLMFLMQPWDRSMHYSDQTIAEAKATEKKLKDYFGVVKGLRRSDWLTKRADFGEAEAALATAVAAFQRDAHDALLDNFDTPGVMSAMLGLVSHTHEYLKAAAAAPSVLLVCNGATAITRLLRVFGVAECEDLGLPIGGGAEGEGGAAASREAVAEPYIDRLVAFRDAVREHAKVRKDPALLELCDALRDQQLAALGVRVEDGDAGSLWKLDDPETLRREVLEKKGAQAAKERAKAANKLAEKEKELDKLRAAATPPAELFKQPRYAGKYSQLDGRGVPTADSEGNPLSKSAAKAVEKEMQQQQKAHDAYNAKLGANPALLPELEAEVGALKAQLG